MIICIDFDGTYTRMPELINSIIDKSKQLGYTVIVATMRYETEVNPLLTELMSKVDKTYFTCREAKLMYLAKLGIEPDLWVDDNPSWLFNNG